MRSDAIDAISGGSAAAPRPGAPPCKQCGSATEMAHYLPRRIGNPAFNIFRCIDCGFIDWVAAETSANPT